MKKKKLNKINKAPKNLTTRKNSTEIGEIFPDELGLIWKAFL